MNDNLIVNERQQQIHSNTKKIMICVGLTATTITGLTLFIVGCSDNGHNKVCYSGVLLLYGACIIVCFIGCSLKSMYYSNSLTNSRAATISSSF